MAGRRLTQPLSVILNTNAKYKGALVRCKDIQAHPLLRAAKRASLTLRPGMGLRSLLHMTKSVSTPMPIAIGTMRFAKAAIKGTVSTLVLIGNTAASHAARLRG